MDMRKWFFLSVIFLALVVGGCGGNGNGGGMAGGGTPDPEPEPMECPAGQTGTYPNCMTPPPPAPAGGHNAVIDGIVNPEVAGDPSMPGPTTKANRPGSVIGGESVFSVEAGDLGMKPRTTIRLAAGNNAPNTLNIDELDKDDMAGTPMKSLEGQFMNQDMDSMLGGFAGSVHEKMTGEGDDKVVDRINVFTDIDAAKSATYASYYGGDVTRNGVTNYEAEDGVLTLAADSADILDLFSGSKIPTGANQSFSVPGEDNSETANVKENEFTGTFNGVAGTYTCTANCTAVTDAMSKLTLTGTLTFTPTEDPMKIMLPGVSYDDDYLSFGYWVQTTGEGDDTKYGVGTFFDGSDPIDNAIVVSGTVEGEATYSGKAAGMYGRKTLNQYGLVVSGSETSGHFTADANLTAYFDGGDIPANKHNRVEGTVTNFMDGDEMISPNWDLKLKPGAEISDFASTFNGRTEGGGTEGNWIGQFFGDPAAGTAADKAYPNAVAGEFTGHFTNGHVIGAFGATRDKK